MDPREPSQGRRQVPVGAGIVRSPAPAAFSPVSTATEAESPTPPKAAATSAGGIHQPGKLPFGLFSVVRRNREIVVFARLVLAPGLRLGFNSPGNSDQQQKGTARSDQRTKPHSIPVDSGYHGSRRTECKFARVRQPS